MDAWSRVVLNFIRRKKYHIFFLCIIIISIFLIIWFGLKGNPIWINFLPEVTSALIILFFGSIVAWVITHNYQRRNDKKQMKNQIINEIQELAFILEETAYSISNYFEKSGKEELHNAQLLTNNLKRKTTIIQAKVHNWFPKFVEKSIQVQIRKEEESKVIEWKKEIIDEKEFKFIKWTFLDFITTLFEYTDFILDYLEKKTINTEEIENLNRLEEKVNHILFYILINLVEY